MLLVGKLLNKLRDQYGTLDESYIEILEESEELCKTQHYSHVMHVFWLNDGVAIKINNTCR